jgi:hypothetical protein
MINQPHLKQLLAANRRLITALEHTSNAIYFDGEDGGDNARHKGKAALEAHREASEAVKHFARVMKDLGVTKECEKCHGTGQVWGMTDRQICGECQEGVIYRD